MPFALRWPVVKQPKLLRALERCLTRAIFRAQRAAAKQLGQRGKPQCGAVSFVQWFSSTLALQPHLPLLVPEGVWSGGAFVELPRRDDGKYAYETKKGVTLVLSSEQLCAAYLHQPRAFAAPGPPPDPDKEISTIRLFRRYVLLGALYQMSTFTRGTGSGNSFSRFRNRSQFIRDLWLRRFNHLCHALRAQWTSAAMDDVLPFTPK